MEAQSYTQRGSLKRCNDLQGEQRTSQWYDPSQALSCWNLDLKQSILGLKPHALQHQTTQLDLESQTGSEQCPDPTISSDGSHQHKSKIFQINRRTISDAILGLSDGLTVPFALSAGLSSLGTTKVVILGGLAELVAGAISMGLGGFLGARSEL